MQLISQAEEIQLLGRLGVSLLVGAIIGWDREIHHKPAGLRTYMLVSLGSALFALIPLQLGFAQVSVDALSRVVQGIAAGVGFIGGGVILRRGSEAEEGQVRGLTSAAAIWVCSALGVAAGTGLVVLALLGAGLTWFILRVVKQFEHRR